MQASLITNGKVCERLWKMVSDTWWVTLQHWCSALCCQPGFLRLYSYRPELIVHRGPSSGSFYTSRYFRGAFSLLSTLQGRCCWGGDTMWSAVFGHRAWKHVTLITQNQHKLLSIVLLRSDESKRGTRTAIFYEMWHLIWKYDMTVIIFCIPLRNNQIMTELFWANTIAANQTRRGRVMFWENISPVKKLATIKCW